MTHIDRSLARRIVVVVVVALLAPLSGCWMIFQSPCETDANCPSGTSCVSGTCYDPNALGSGGFLENTCDGTTECETGVCADYDCLTQEEAANVVDEDLYVTTSDDWDRLASATTVVGDVIIGSDSSSYDPQSTTLVASGEVVLPNLLRVQGSFYFHGQLQVTSISLPNLRAIDGDFEAIGMPELVSISLPEFAVVPTTQQLDPSTGDPYVEFYGEILVEGTPKLEVLSAPKIGSIGWITIDPAGDIDEPVFGAGLVVELPLLTRAGNVDLWSMTPASTLTFPALDYVNGRIYVHTLNGAHTLSFPALTSVGGELTVWYTDTLETLDLPSLETTPILDIDDNDLLATISVPSLATVTQSLTISENPLLTTIDAPSLTSVNNGFTVTNNPSLDVCQAKALAEQASPGGAVDLSGNLGDESTCP